MRLYVVFLLFTTSFSVYAQSGEKIISRHLEKYGQATWDQIQTLQISGKHVTIDYEAFPINLFIKDNDKVRIEGINQRNGYILTVDHKVFWSAGVEEGPTLVLEKQILNHGLTIGSPIAKYKGELDFQGLVVFRGSTFYSFVKESDQLEVNYLIDRENDELRHIIVTLNESEPLEATLTFDKYKSHHGLLTPTAIVVEMEDQYREWVFDDILLGIAIDDKIFEKPNSQ